MAPSTRLCCDRNPYFHVILSTPLAAPLSNFILPSSLCSFSLPSLPSTPTKATPLRYFFLPLSLSYFSFSLSFLQHPITIPLSPYRLFFLVFFSPSFSFNTLTIQPQQLYLPLSPLSCSSSPSSSLYTHPSLLSLLHHTSSVILNRPSHRTSPSPLAHTLHNTASPSCSCSSSICSFFTLYHSSIILRA